jgi:midasin
MHAIRQLLAVTSRFESNATLASASTNAAETPVPLSSAADNILSALRAVDARALLSTIDENRRRRLMPRVMLLALRVLTHVVRRAALVTPAVLECVSHVATRLTLAHRRQSEEKAAKLLARDSLYRRREKRRATETEDEGNERAVREMFPSFEREFADLTERGTAAAEAPDDLPESAAARATDDDDAALRELEEQDMAQMYMPPEVAEALARTHAALFRSLAPLAGSGEGGADEFAPIDEVDEGAFALASEVFTSTRTSPSASADVASSVALVREMRRVEALLKTTTALEPTKGGERVGNMAHLGHGQADVYRDAMPAEVSLAYEPVRDLAARAADMMTQFPANDQLLTITRAAKRVLSLPLSAPLMRVLAGVESLLATAHRWEAFAARKYSIAENISRMSALVTRWRHLELDNWRTLLDRNERECRRSAMQFWFALRGALQHYRRVHNELPPWDVTVADEERDAELAAAATIGAVPPKKDAAAAAERQTLRVLCDDFVRLGTVGEFRARLALLYSFHCQLVVEEGIIGATSRDLSTTLLNVYSYYSQFVPIVAAHIETVRAPLERSLADYLKVTRWDDRNYARLVESSNKLKRRLTLLEQKWKAALSAPVSKVLDLKALVTQPNEPILDEEREWTRRGHAAASAAPSLTMAQLAARSPHWATRATVAPNAKRIAELLSSVRAFADADDAVIAAVSSDSEQQQQQPLWQRALGAAGRMGEWRVGALRDPIAVARDAWLGLAELRDEIIGGANALKSSATATRQSKKLALVGLLHRLRDIGITFGANLHTNTSGDVERLLCDAAVGPALRALGGGDVDVLTLDGIFHRLWARVQFMRLALPTHSPDLDNAQASRALASCEHTFALAAEQRRALAAAGNRLRHVMERARAMAAFVDGAAPLAQSDAGAATLVAQQAALAQLTCVMHEAVRACDDFAVPAEVRAPIVAAHTLAAARLAESDAVVRQCVLLDGAFVPLATPRIALSGRVGTALGANNEALVTLRASLEAASAPAAPPLRRLLAHALRLVAAFGDATTAVAAAAAASDAPSSASVIAVCSGVVERAMLAVQGLVHHAQARAEEDREARAVFDADETARQESDPTAVRRDYMVQVNVATLSKRLVASLDALSLPAVVAGVDELNVRLAGASAVAPALVGAVARKCAALLVAYAGVAHDAVLLAAERHHRTLRFAYCLAAVLGTVVRDGFCKSADDDAAAEGEGEAGEGGAGGAGGEGASAGTGVGEGTGEKDVSDEITNQSQVEGLQGDSNDSSKQGGGKDKNQPEARDRDEGIEMDNDFDDGDMHDIARAATARRRTRRARPPARRAGEGGRESRQADGRGRQRRGGGARRADVGRQEGRARQARRRAARGRRRRERQARAGQGAGDADRGEGDGDDDDEGAGDDDDGGDDGGKDGKDDKRDRGEGEMMGEPDAADMEAGEEGEEEEPPVDDRQAKHGERDDPMNNERRDTDDFQLPEDMALDAGEDDEGDGDDADQFDDPLNKPEPPTVQDEEVEGGDEKADENGDGTGKEEEKADGDAADDEKNKQGDQMLEDEKAAEEDEKAAEDDAAEKPEEEGGADEAEAQPPQVGEGPEQPEGNRDEKQEQPDAMDEDETGARGAARRAALPAARRQRGHRCRRRRQRRRSGRQRGHRRRQRQAERAAERQQAGGAAAQR